MTEFQQHLENVVKYFLNERNLHYRNEFELSGWYFLTSESHHSYAKITRSDIQKAFIQECGIVKARSYYTTYFTSFNVFLHEWVRDGNDPEFKVNPFLKFLITVDNYFFEMKMNHTTDEYGRLKFKRYSVHNIRLTSSKYNVLYQKYSEEIKDLYEFSKIVKTYDNFENIYYYLFDYSNRKALVKKIEKNKFVEIFDYMCFLLPVFNKDIVDLVCEYLDNKVVNRQIFC